MLQMKPLLSGPPIKRTQSGVPKLTCFVSLYNEPLFSGHLFLADVDTKINRIWLISIVKTSIKRTTDLDIRTVVDK